MLRSLLLVAVLVPTTLLAQRSAEEHLGMAQRAYDANSLEPSLAHADSAIQLNAAVAGGYKLRGDIKQKQHNLHGALLDYTKSEKLEPNNSRLYVSRSAVLISEGRLRDAIRDCDMALKLDPDDADALYNRACADYMGRNPDAAMRSLERAIKLRPDLADALFLRGVVRGEQYKERAGIADIEAAILLKPEIPGAIMSLAVLLYESERFDEAIERFTQVINLKDNDLGTAYYYRADCYYKMGDKDKACPDWRRSGEAGDKDAQFIVRNYCNTDADKIPRKPNKRRNTVIEF